MSPFIFIHFKASQKEFKAIKQSQFFTKIFCESYRFLKQWQRIPYLKTDFITIAPIKYKNDPIIDKILP
jgi:hypothetical protein